MEKKILAYLNRWPGARKRSIARSVRIFSATLIPIMSQMEKDGLIQRVPVKDIANMKFYDKWYLTEAGYRAIMNVD